jgi:hypothetical protein
VFLLILTGSGQNQDMQGNTTSNPKTTVGSGVDRALTRKQVAELSTYSEKTLANLAVLEQGPPFRKCRGKVLYLESEVMAWLRGLPRGGGQAA